MFKYSILIQFAILVFTTLLIVSCDKGKKSESGISQVHSCLQKGYDAYKGSEEINKILVKIRNGNWESEDLIKMDSLADLLTTRINQDIEKLKLKKENVPEKELYNSTIDYLKAIEQYEKGIPEFLKMYLDTTEMVNDEINQRMRNLALDVKEKAKNWENTKIAFYANNSISQTEIDSLEKIIIQ